MPASDSSSDEYHDCESPSKLHIKRSSKDIPFEFPAPPDSTKKPKEDAFQIQRPKEEDDKEQVQRRDDFNFVEPKSTHRQRFKDLKKDLLNNDDDGEDAINDSENPSNSSSKSIDAASKNTVQSSHPFRVIDNDAMSIHSMTSLGRVGRILSGSLDPSSVSVGRDSNQLHMAIQQQQQQQQQQQHDSTSLGNSNSSSNATITQTLTNRTRDSDNQSLNSDNTEYSFTMHRPTILQEPDVIASTKLAHSKTTDSITAAGPIAPPRLRRNKDKSRKVSTSSTDQLPNFNEGLNLLKLNRFSDSQQITTTTTSSSSLASMATTTTESNAAFVLKSGESVDKILPSPATLYAITKEIENSFKETTNSTTFEPSAPPTVSQGSPSTSSISRSTFTGSLNKISSYSFHGQSPPQPYYKSSPSNSVKSNSAPGRVTSMDPNLTLSINKVTQGHFVVKPQDDLLTRAEGPKTSTQNLCDVRKKSTATLEDIERLQRIRSEILESTSGDRFKLAGVGSNSLGNDTRYSENRESDKSAMKERRKSAGDEEILKQLNVYVRTRTDSGQIMSDHEILEQVPVKNLDTGENFPLSAADEKLEQCINPLSLYIMHLTSHIRESDEESVGGMTVNSELPPGEEEDIEIEEGGRLRRKTQKIKRFLATTAKKAKNTAKSIASEVSHARHKEDIAEIVDVMNPEQNIKIKASKTNTGPYEFAKLQHVQDLSVQGETTGAVWCMKFSPCGRLLATAGQDRLLRIWVLKDAYHFFEELIKKYNADQKSSPTPSQESLVSHHSFEESAHILQAAASTTGPFVPVPYRTYSGHTSDLLDVSWSKSHFILSSSMDKTVRLWHISRKECLCCFQHIEFVTAIAFHPLDDSFFLSGSLDGKLRLWNIPNKKVFLWNEVDGRRQLITAANFCQNGKFAVVGTYDGRCLFYNTEQLKYHTQIHVRSTRGKNATGRKITGIEPMPGEDKILVTSNDSRIRLYDLRDLNLSCKYKGYLNDSQQIKASFSHDGKYIISGSENQSIYIWKTHHDYAKLSSVRRDRSDFWEGIKAHNATVTCAIFSPHPETIIKPESDSEISSDKASHSSQPADPLVEQRTKGCGGHVLVSVDFTGCIKVFLNKTKPKHSSLPYTAILD